MATEQVPKSRAPPNAPAHLRAPLKREDAWMLRGSPEDCAQTGLPVRCSATLDGVASVDWWLAGRRAAARARGAAWAGGPTTGARARGASTPRST